MIHLPNPLSPLKYYKESLCNIFISNNGWIWFVIKILLLWYRSLSIRQAMSNLFSEKSNELITTIVNNDKWYWIILGILLLECMRELNVSWNCNHSSKWPEKVGYWKVGKVKPCALTPRTVTAESATDAPSSLSYAEVNLLTHSRALPTAA